MIGSLSKCLQGREVWMILLALPARRLCLTDPEANSAFPPATLTSDNVIAGVPVASIDAVMYAPRPTQSASSISGKWDERDYEIQQTRNEGTVAGPSKPREDSDRRK